MSHYPAEEAPARTDSDAGERPAVLMADQLCRGFIHHDRRKREAAIDAFAAVDTLQFDHLSEERAREAATGYVDALWAKDEIERDCTVEDRLDREALEAADWSPVHEAFADRADAAGIDPRYADLTTEAWRRHKTGGEYWTPMMHAQTLELRAALREPDYPDKPRHGRSGFGPEPVRYALGNELHDMRRWREARAVMIPYFERVVGERGGSRAEREAGFEPADG